MSYTPGGGSAFGPTAEVTRLHQLDLNTELVLGANPWLAQDPDALMRLANSGANPLDLVNNAGALAGLDNIDSLGRALSTMDEIGQRAAYGKLTEQQQRALANVGFAPPERNDGGGFISDMFDVTGDVIGKVMKPVGSVVGTVVGPAMDLLTWIGDVPAHFYRAIRQMDGWQQWLALGLAAAAVVATGGLAAAAGAGMIGAGGVLGTVGGAAAGALGGAGAMGSLATLGTLGAVGLGAGILATAPTAVSNPTEWWDLMNPFGAKGVGRGERIFTRQGQQRAFDILGGAEHLHALARDFAAEMSVEDIALEFAGVRDAANFNVMQGSIERIAASMVDPGTPEYQRIFEGLSKLAQQPEFEAAVSELQSSKISPGRDLAHAVGMENGDFGYGLVSGSADALWLLTMDPLLALGKLGKLQQLTRRGLDTPSGTDAIERLTRMVNEDPAVGAVVNQVTNAVESGRFTDMPAAWRTLYLPMREYRAGLATANNAPAVFDAQGFMEYIAHGAGLQRIMEGKGTIRGIEQIVISTQNKSQGMGKFVESVRQFQRGVTDPVLWDDMQRQAKMYGVEADVEKMLPSGIMDEAVDSGFVYRELNELPINEAGAYRAGKAVGNGLLYLPGGRSLGNFISGISTMIPANKALSLVGDEAVTDIPRFVETMGRMMNMPSGYRDEWLNTILSNGSVETRRKALESFMDSVFTAGGFKSTDEWATLTNKYLRHHEQAYALGGLDVLRNADGTHDIRGLLPDLHSAVYMVMPNLREMSQLVRQGHFLKHVAKLTDSSFAEQSMSRVIKPGWLMRIGFIPRAAGEEMLAFALRMSEGGLAQEFAARKVAQHNIYRETRKALVDAGGDINKLDAVQRAALETRFPTHLKPLIAMSRRLGWQDADAHLLDNYVNWGIEARRTGLGIELPDYLPEWAKVIMAGREGSVRRMVLNGVDRELVEAGELWIGRHADAIMRATSSMNASLFEKSVVNPDTATMMIQDPRDPAKRVEVMVGISGERQRVGAADWRYHAAVSHRVQEPFHDSVMRPIWANANTMRFPEGKGYGGILAKSDIANALEQSVVLDSWASKKLGLALTGRVRPDNMRALATEFREVDMIFEAEVIEAIIRSGDFSGFNVSQALYAKADSLVDPNLAREQARVRALGARIEQYEPTINGFSALNVDESEWLAAVITRQVANDHRAFDVGTVRRWAEHDPTTPIPKPPKRRFYRGVPNDRSWFVDTDGSLVFLATEQGHFAGGKAVSLTMEPQQAMVYASSGVDSGVESSYLTGTIFEIDGDEVLEQGGKTMEQLNAAPLPYFDASDADPGVHLIGMGGGDQYTEITWYTGPDGTTSDELRIPAGKWRAMNHDDMKTVVVDAGMRERTKFTTRVQNLSDDIGGFTPEEIMYDLDISLDEVIESLDDIELADMRALTEEFDSAGWGDGSMRYEDPDRTSLLDGIVHWATEDEGLTLGNIAGRLSEASISPSLQTKLLDWLGEDLTEGLPRIDMLNAFVKSTTDKPGVLGSLVRGRISGGPRAESDVLGGLLATNRMRGRGGYETPAGEFPGWAPFIENDADWQEHLVNELTAALHRPENAQYTRQQKLITHTEDGTAVARPPEDGVVRVYSPVSPVRTSRVNSLLATRRPPELEFNQFWVDEFIRKYADGSAFDPRDPEINAVMAEFAAFDGRHDISPAAMEIAQLADQWLHLSSPGMRASATPDDFGLVLDQITDAMRANDSTYDDLAVVLLGDNRQYHWTDRSIDQMSEEEKVAIIGRVLRDYDTSRAKYSLGMSMPIDSVAFDDPRIAKWVSSVLADVDSPDPFRVGQLDVPRLALNDQGAGRQGVRLANAYEGGLGRMWETDARYVGMHTPLDAPAFQHIKSTYTNPITKKTETTWDVVPGASMETAYRDAASAMVEKVLAESRRGVSEVHTFRGPVASESGTQTVARRVGNQYVPLEPGEAISIPEDFYLVDADNKVVGSVDYGSNSWFEQSINEQSDETMMSILGPMLRDVYEEDAGLSLRVAKDFRERKGRFGQTEALPVGTDLESSTDVMMTHSRIDDVSNEPSAALPNVAIARNYKAVNDTLWDRIVRYGFDHVIGPAIDSLARKPMSFHYYAAAYKQQKRNASWLLNTELFETQFADEFADVLRILDGESTMTPELIDDARLVARQAFGADLAGAEPEEVRQFLVSISRDHDGYVETLDSVIREYRTKAMSSAAARSPYQDRDGLAEFVNAHADNEADMVVAQAAERLRDNVNRNALSINLSSEGVGGRTSAERLVSAYNEAVPEAMWELGSEAVTTYLREYVPGLPHDFSRDQWRVLKSARDNLAHITEMSSDIAAMRAMENVIPFLDSHEQRSMFAEYGRNFIPFWYAEENFIKRWSRTMSLGKFANPFGAPIPSGGLDTIRKAQLTYMGIKSAGIIRTDANGDDWVVYPGSGLLMEAAAKVLPGDLLPMGVLFQAQADSLLPGVTLDGNVGLSPFIAAPTQFIGHMFPETANVRRGLLGDIGSSRNALSQFVPTVVSNMWAASFGDENSQTRYASAMMAAISFMEARGDGLTDGATAADVDEYLDTVRNHARIIMFSQAIAGYVVPGAPSSIVTGAEGFNELAGLNIEDPKQITSSVYQSYMQNLGMEKGTEQFLAAFPQADLEDVINPFALTASMSQSISGAPLPATKNGMAWYTDNQAWVDQMPEAGAWLIPPDEDQDFDFYSYSQQIVSGLRKRKTPQEYLTAIKYRQGADPYFRAKDAYDEAVLRVGSDQVAKNDLENKWGIWKSQYLAANPLFAEELLSGDARQRRARTISQMRNAVNDPSAPESPYSEAIRQMTQAFDNYEAARKLLSSRRDADSREKLRSVKAAFADWATAWQLTYPEISRLWDSVYRPESGVE